MEKTLAEISKELREQGYQLISFLINQNGISKRGIIIDTNETIPLLEGMNEVSLSETKELLKYIPHEFGLRSCLRAFILN